ncbi:hypothetical protein MNBD_GAMMA21-2339 [hydrothermal vent metagenome]|uniref:Uncharacterized protein n=1 Tax=hydrothermal vent metagenome TaxID=652676 RepID=A0A3B1A220_9ZZZZ
MKKFSLIISSLIILFIVLYITFPMMGLEKYIVGLFIENNDKRDNETYQETTVFGVFYYKVYSDPGLSGVSNITFIIDVQDSPSTKLDINNYSELSWNLIQSPYYDAELNYGLRKEFKSLNNTKVKISGVIYNPCESGKKLRSETSPPADCLIGIPNSHITLKYSNP